MLLKDLGLGLNHSLDLHGCAKELPFLVLVSSRDLEVKVIKDGVNIHALPDLLTQLSNGGWDFRYVLLCLGEFLDVLWDSADALIDLVELCRKFVVLLLGLLSDELNLLFNDVAVLSNVHVADVLAVYLEDANCHKLRDLFA